ncbi:hypothetical protein V5067_17715 [Enterobacter asburiae]|nr:hypothetical protein [Enterobacter asburiae]MDO2453614.1 hypothetical protein [Enterobacter asburiae]
MRAKGKYYIAKDVDVMNFLFNV